MRERRSTMLFRAKSTDRDILTANKVAVILSQSEGWGKMALGIVKIYLGSPFSANQRSSRSVCRGQLSWTHVILLADTIIQKLVGKAKICRKSIQKLKFRFRCKKKNRL